MKATPAVPFEFGGRLSLDLTWTVRFRAVLPSELLVVPTDLGAWLDAVSLPVAVPVSSRDLDDVRDLREVIHRSATALIDGGVISADDRARLNAWAALPAPFPVMADDGGLRLGFPAGEEVTAALSAIARDAIELFAKNPGGRLRRCEGPQCSLLFHDDSRPGSRRWCSTSRCGNKVNTTSYRERRRSEA